MGQGLGIQVAELDGSSSIVVTAIQCVKMDKTGHAAGSYKLLYFFPSTIIKYSSSLSAHITLCPGSLGKMSSSKAICQVSQMCFSELFQAVSPPFYVEHCFMKFLTPSASSCRKHLFFTRAASQEFSILGWVLWHLPFQTLTSMVGACRAL